MNHTVKEFYNQIQFPGHYTKNSLSLHSPEILNPYLKIINSVLDNNIDIVDIGCGSGLISNFFAFKYPKSNFTGIDFADSIDYATKYSVENQLTNVNYIKTDFSGYESNKQYDVVICQGVLHHMPNYKENIIKIKSMVKPQGHLILGLYHPWGKLAKKLFQINYRNKILFQDQELNPYEKSFTFSEVNNLCGEFKLKTCYPLLFNRLVALPNLFNFKNGGLTTYILEKS